MQGGTVPEEALSHELNAGLESAEKWRSSLSGCAPKNGFK
jgi:hypothetical protein